MKKILNKINLILKIIIFLGVNIICLLLLIQPFCKTIFYALRRKFSFKGT